MIAGLRGTVRRVQPMGLTVAVGPVDVDVLVPAPIAMALAPGKDVDLRTRLYVRDDQISLFGFSSDDELGMFNLLLSVSGVGPRAAMGVLSALDAAEIRQAIAADDTRALARAPGIGQRAAARIVAELKGKIGALTPADRDQRPDVRSAALEALLNMGYAAAEAKRALESAAADGSVEDAVRGALGDLADR
ncbi:MAG: Holliday junction branch migration protein RuvA [Chloroflexi bacterium]|nr:Holliday junction branch migration protein RuvA [Chloroflexota bacterium]